MPNEQQIEPSKLEGLETSGDKFRREWAENGADWSWQLLRFLQGRRVNEIGLDEIVTTQTYARSLQRERDSLRWVAVQAEQLRPLSEEDKRRLIERDFFLINLLDGKTLGHSNWVKELEDIPRAVAHARAVDASLFPNT